MKNTLDRQILEEIERDLSDHTDIVDDQQTHLIDNGATVQIADDELDGRTSGGSFRDDFLAHMDQMTEASVGPSGELLDDFDQKAQMQVSQHAALVQTAPFSRFQPPSSTSAVLGTIVDVVAGNNPITAIYWNGASDSETTPVTITLSPVNPEQNNPGADDIRAIVKFGTRDSLTTVLVDVGQGCQLTVSGSTLVVDLEFPTSTLYPAGVTNKIQASLSFFPIVKSVPATKTERLGEIAGAGSGSIRIPPFSKTVTTVRENGGAFTINFLEKGGTVQYSQIFAANAVMDPMFIAANITRIQIQNTSGAAQDFTLIFGLSL